MGGEDESWHHCLQAPLNVERDVNTVRNIALIGVFCVESAAAGRYVSGRAGYCFLINLVPVVFDPLRHLSPEPQYLHKNGNCDRNQ